MHKYLNTTKMKIFSFFLLRKYILSNSIFKMLVICCFVYKRKAKKCHEYVSYEHTCTS